MFQRLYETQLDDLAPIHVLYDLCLSVNPIAFILVLPLLFLCLSIKEINVFIYPLPVQFYYPFYF